MADIVVGIADLKCSNNKSDILVTYALGSCIAVAVYDPQLSVGGLLHYMLPDSTLDENKAKDCPGMFADTAIPLLFKSCYALGAEKRRMRVKVAGGARHSGRHELFPDRPEEYHGAAEDLLAEQRSHRCGRYGQQPQSHREAQSPGREVPCKKFRR